MTQEKFKYIIIGAGITGVSLGVLLREKGEDDFIILEAEEEPGGLCKTKRIGDHVLDIGGGHFMYTKMQEVYDFIFRHIPKDRFNYFDRISKIRVEGLEVDYPLESNLWQLPIDKEVKYLISAVQSGEVVGKKQPRNYEEWIRWKLGDIIADKYMLPYNEKIWGVRPEEMDIDWLHKIPKLDTEEIVRNSLTKNQGVEKMPSHPGFYYPKEGGFQTIFDALYSEVKENVRLNTSVEKILRKDSSWEVNNKYRAEVVINTAPWPSLFEALGRPSKLEKDFEKLVANSIVVSLWEEDYKIPWHWVYEPDTRVEYHREFYIHNFAPHSAENGMYTETNLKYWPTRRKLRNKGKRKGPIYEYVNDFAYPIPIIGHSKAIKSILAYYKKQNLYGVGRWGQWKYFNSDVCIKEAMNLVSSLF